MYTIIRQIHAGYLDLIYTFVHLHTHILDKREKIKHKKQTKGKLQWCILFVYFLLYFGSLICVITLTTLMCSTCVHLSSPPTCIKAVFPSPSSLRLIPCVNIAEIFQVWLSCFLILWLIVFTTCVLNLLSMRTLNTSSCPSLIYGSTLSDTNDQYVHSIIREDLLLHF